MIAVAVLRASAPPDGPEWALADLLAEIHEEGAAVPLAVRAAASRVAGHVERLAVTA